MKRTPLTRRTPLVDCHGFDLEAARWHLEAHYGLKTADWPNIPRVKNRLVCELMHGQFTECWNCGTWYDGWSLERRIEAHHIIGGFGNGRYDHVCNIAMLCGLCHSRAKSKQLPQGRVLYLKVTKDPVHTDWVWLSLIGRKFLPDMITEEVVG